MRTWVNRQKTIYSGRSYQSHARFLGSPWIDIRVSDRDEVFEPKAANGGLSIGLLGIGGGGLAYCFVLLATMKLMYVRKVSLPNG